MRKGEERVCKSSLLSPARNYHLVKNKNRDNFELESYYEKKEVDLKFDEDLKQLSNFYRFANRNKCFLKDKIIDVRKLKFGEFIIKVNLINSAPFIRKWKQRQGDALYSYA